MNHVQQTIWQLNSEIEECQRCIDVLKRLTQPDMVTPVATATSPATAKRMVKTLRKIKADKPKKVRGPYKKRGVVTITEPGDAASAEAAALAFETSLTLGGCMKAFIRKTPSFTGEEMRTALLESKTSSRLVEDSSPGAISFNLKYWSSRGHLNATEGSPLEATYTVANKEFFAA